MDFFEAMQELKAGKQIRVKKWEKENFICLQEEQVKIAGKQRSKYKILDQDLLECSILPMNSMLQGDWETIE